MIRKNTSSHRF